MAIIIKLKQLRRFLIWALRSFSKEGLGYCGKNSAIEFPCHIESRKDIYLYDNARIRNNVRIINAPGEKVIINKYTVVAAGVTIITNSHRSTVGIPQFLLGASHINDKSADVIIEEDVWIGANATIMPGVTLGRGCIVAAGAIVTKSVPPYALVAGTPAKIIAKKFAIEGVLQHERILYPENERFTSEYLEELFETHFKEKKVYGINSKLSINELERLNDIKKKLNFIDPFS